MATALSQKEETEIRQLRQAGVLVPVSQAALTAAQSRTSMIPCADGHHFADLYTTHAALCGEHEDPMHHPLSLNGGALLLPEDSPLRLRDDGGYDDEDYILLKHLKGAIQLKTPRAIILYAHAPCGMVQMHGLSIYEEFELLVKAKQRVREFVYPYGVSDVRAWFHVAYPDGARKTYHFKREAWEHVRTGLAA